MSDNTFNIINDVYDLVLKIQITRDRVEGLANASELYLEDNENTSRFRIDFIRRQVTGALFSDSDYRRLDLTGRIFNPLFPIEAFHKALKDYLSKQFVLKPPKRPNWSAGLDPYPRTEWEPSPFGNRDFLYGDQRIAISPQWVHWRHNTRPNIGVRYNYDYAIDECRVLCEELEDGRLVSEGATLHAVGSIRRYKGHPYLLDVMRIKESCATWAEASAMAYVEMDNPRG